MYKSTQLGLVRYSSTRSKHGALPCFELKDASVKIFGRMMDRSYCAYAEIKMAVENIRIHYRLCTVTRERELSDSIMLSMWVKARIFAVNSIKTIPLSTQFS